MRGCLIIHQIKSPVDSLTPPCLHHPRGTTEKVKGNESLYNSIDYTEICLAAQVARVQVSSPFILILRSPPNWNQQFDWYERQSGFHPDTMKKRWHLLASVYGFNGMFLGRYLPGGSISPIGHQGLNDFRCDVWVDIVWNIWGRVGPAECGYCWSGICVFHRFW